MKKRKFRDENEREEEAMERDGGGELS